MINRIRELADAPLIDSLQGLGKRAWIVINLGVLLIVGLLDAITGYELSFSLFYLLPIGLATWYVGPTMGLAISSLSAAAGLLADVASGRTYSLALIWLWNAGIRFGIFAISAALLGALKTELERRQQLLQMDFLTGAVSPAYFQELLAAQMATLEREHKPFTMAYVDIDNFKEINDRHGHAAGDEVLRSVVAAARAELRTRDAVARLGGDEIVVLLADTSRETAPLVIERGKRAIEAAAAGRPHPVTFSIGAMTFNKAPPSPTEAIQLVDELMYRAKNRGKDCVEFGSYPA